MRTLHAFIHLPTVLMHAPTRVPHLPKVLVHAPTRDPTLLPRVLMRTQHRSHRNRGNTYVSDDVAAQIMLRVQLLGSVGMEDGREHSRVPVEEVLLPLTVPALVGLQPLRQHSQTGGRSPPQRAYHGLEHHPANVQTKASVVQLV